MDECIKSPCVADLANELLVDGEGGRSAADMTEELVDAAGPMLGEFIQDEAVIKALFQSAVAHFTGADTAGAAGGGGGAGAAGRGGGGGGGGGAGGGAAEGEDGDGGEGGEVAAAAAAAPEYCLNLEPIILVGRCSLTPASRN